VKDRNHLRDVVFDGKVMLSWNSEKEFMAMWLKIGSLADLCECFGLYNIKDGPALRLSALFH
jgi:hypothetical protein